MDIRNCDNMELMKEFPDNYFDLEIVDPPYGINFGEFNRTNKDSNGVRHKANKYKQADWDDAIPNDDYFQELKRVSKDQIVWGGNYFPSLWQNGCKGFIFWYKQNPVPNFSDGELAYCSMNKPAACFNYKYYGNIEGNTSASKKVHPTQKPIALYEWLLKNYAKPDQKILDTHLGSGSIAIAIHNVNTMEGMNLEFTACELDEDYYKAAMERIDKHCRQKTIFDI